MTIKRFKKILRNLHLNDNAHIPDKTSEDYDKLYKIRPLLDLINQASQKNAKDSSSQSIDESMILFKGRSSMKQYMPLKPIKRGYKVWCRCDSKTGYLYEFYIYTGKSETGTEEGLGSKVVKKLTEKLINKALEEYHIIVTFDNFFCEYTLMQYLYENCIYATGTVRRHRTHLPVLVKTKQKLAKGQYKWRVKGNVSFLVWQDTKEVLLLSNAFHPKVGKTTVLRTQKDGTKQEISCPLAIKEYTKRMGGVDRFDRIKGTYSVGRRSRRWWVRIFFFLLDASITNAYLLYCQNTNATKLSHLEFRVSVARGLFRLMPKTNNKATNSSR
ncbi:piggyBac transposable element-derived protein 4-like [Melitaea cinxia]|uniref:piggyBac transposable element-derived protein 4-like n=1 Tax=Melitaea cinxia TaxID=113334 RepID=UPI001E26FC0E|nr:piggyBac transposable element-derived protein 4-like [Melitaea cinxia]